MTLIEGVGDEVTVFVAILLLLIVLTLAWVSTGVTDRPFVSVIVLDGRTFQQFISRLRGRRTTPPADGSSTSNTAGNNQPNATSTDSASTEPAEGVTAPTDPEGPVGGVTPTVETSVKTQEEQNNGEEVETVLEACTPASTPGSEGFVHLGSSSDDAESAPVQETPVAPEDQPESERLPCAPEGNELRQRRLAFFSNIRRNDTTPGQTENASSTLVAEPTSAEESRPETQVGASSEPQVGASPEPEVVASAEPQVGASTEPQQGPSSDGPRTQSDPVSEGFEPLDGHIRIRIKYLDDRQRWVQARPEETIGQFKRAHFGAELGENTMIRFIYNGRELTRDGQSLASYNIGDESVIHCLVSHVTRPNADDMGHGVVQFDVGTLMFPLFGLILALIWYSRFTYKQYFNTMSTLTLIGISFLFVVALLASFRVQDNPDPTEAE